MEIKEIIEKCREFEISEQRRINDNYAEIVMYTKEMFKWSMIFNEILGAPVSLAGVDPTPEDMQITKKYGGIFTNQILYKKDFQDKIIIAMFWPWQDGKRITVKVAILAK